MTAPSNLFLRRVLTLDAATCAGAGLLMAIGAPSLAPLLGLPANLLLAAGLPLLPLAAFLAWLGRSPELPRGLVWTVIVGNAVWVVASVIVLVAYPATALGYAFVIAQALAVFAFAELEFVGLRRAAV